MRQSARDLVAALPNATGGLINLEKDSSLTKEHNWPLYAPHVFAQTVRAWIRETPLPKESRNSNNKVRQFADPR